MCGIAGFYQNRPEPVPEDLLFRMVGRLRHRGPDEAGACFDARAALGSARLSIVGLDGGIQPIGNEDGSLWIVYNGEAFNYPELREELLRRGHRFTTQTDTEVVLHLYEECGPRALERINGQFALAIRDLRRDELFLARDRLGIRPLYYMHTPRRFLFASEIKALFADPEARREIDPEALAQVFTFWTTLSPRTPFRDVRQVRPGHYMIVRDGQAEERSWWRIPLPGPGERWEGSFDEAREELAALLRDAVRVRLRADVPVGSYLSGGLDSSIVASLAGREAGNRLRTFSIGFEGADFDETPWQDVMIRHLGTEHSRILVTNAAIREHFAETVLHCERPVLRTAPVPLLLLSRLVQRSGYKVVLTGEGADEVFGGYNIFKEAKIRAFWARAPGSQRRPLLLQRLYPYVFRNPGRGKDFLQQFFAVRAEDLHDPLLSHRLRWENGMRNLVFLCDEARAAVDAGRLMEELEALLPEGFAGRDVLEKAQWLEMAIFLSDYLLSSQGDRVAMANSLELRHPYLDVRIVEFAARLPAHWKIRGLREKRILKEAFRHALPASVGERPKQPYRAPVREVFFGPSPDPLIAELLSEESLRRSGLFHPGRVRQLVRRLADGPPGSAGEGQNMAITGIVSAQLLHHQFVACPLETDQAAPPERIVRLPRAAARERSAAAAGFCGEFSGMTPPT